MDTTTKGIEVLARELAAGLGLTVTVTAFESKRSDKLGRQVRVRIHSTDKRATWGATKSIGKALAAAGLPTWLDKGSHYEARIGAGPTTNGWLNGSTAEVRVYPDAPPKGERA